MKIKLLISIFLILKNPNPEKLLVTAIACFDRKKNVDDFMAREKIISTSSCPGDKTYG